MNDLQKFYELLQAEVISEAQGTGDSAGDFKENVFTRILTEDLAAAGALESPVVSYYEQAGSSAAVKVNAYSIPEEDSCLDLVVAAYFNDDTPRRLQGSDLERLIGMGTRYFQAATKKLHQQVDHGSESYAMARAIYDSKERLDRIRITVVTNGLAVQRKELKYKEKVGAWNISYELWDLERLRRFRSSGATHEPVAVDLSAFDGGVRCAAVSDKKLGYQTCVAILPGKILHDWYDEYGARIMELNVRSYLQARGKVNQKMLETILKEPERFLSYNNGITIVAEEISYTEAGNQITSLQGLQIVNGGQTTATIHRAAKEHGADLSHVYVQAKITVVPSHIFEEVVPDISKYSNTQNKVTEVDLGANHSFHIGVERVATATWTPGEQSKWFYERSRGSFQTRRNIEGRTKAARDKFDRTYPTGQKITKEELARYANTWKGLVPLANKGGQKSFVGFMESLPKMEKGWEPSREEYREIVAKAILFRETQRLAKERKLNAFAINIVIYTVALLAEKTGRRIDLQDIWNRQALPDQLMKLIKKWLVEVAELLKSSAGSRNPGEWFKQEGCWRALKEATTEWPVPKYLEDCLVPLYKMTQVQLTSATGAVAECMKVDAETWLRVQVWGNESGDLKPWQLGLANTLSGYAAGGWKKVPSEKQAKHAIGIISFYTENSA